MAMMSNAWTNDGVSQLIWLCACISVTIFAYGSARSWRAKAAWFSSSARPIAQTNPPQALS
jgi:hypothetical protein